MMDPMVVSPLWLGASQESVTALAATDGRHKAGHDDGRES
jgi:hypothetical protein